MDSSAHSTGSRQTEFRLLKPMPSRQEAASDDHVSMRTQPWDTQIRRLFPARETPAAQMPSVAGIQLGHFELEERIARGGMGTVFRSRDLRLDRVVALKVLSQEQLRDPAAVSRFQNEARAAAKLDHENIARVYYVGEDRGVHFIAFEYVRGTTVREAIGNKGHLSQDEAVNYTLQAAEALRHTDVAGVVHRDIKPSNLIVTPSGRVKLVDLGLARQLNPAEELDLTVTGTTLGTFDYISPEQARDPRNVDVRSDIYSLGCTLYQMLTGSPPYPHGGGVDKLLQHNAGRPPDPCELNPRVSPRLALVVQRMMASNPDERYPSPQALIDELSDLAEGLGLRATAPEGTIWRKPLYRSNAPWWEENRGWLLAFAAIFLLATLGNNLYQWAHTLKLGQSDSVAAAPRDDSTLPPDPQSPTAPQVESPPATSVVDSPRSKPAATPRTAAPPALARSPTTTTATPPSKNPASVASTATSLPPAETTDAAAGDSPRSTAAGDSPAAAGELQTLAQSVLQELVAAGIVSIQPTNADDSKDPGPASSGGDATGDRPTATGGLPSRSNAVETPFAVLGPDGTSVGSYATLEAACHVAKTGSTVEIRQDGPLKTLQKPVLIQNKRLTIRAAGGQRPQLRFAAGDAPLTEPVLRMIDVVDGAVELYGLDLVLDVDNQVFADEWVLLGLSRAREAVLRRVTVTVVNRGWRPAMIIERRIPYGSPSAMMPQAEPMRDAEIQISDCLFRGQASLYVDRSLEPASVRISESAMAVDGDVFRFDGADRADMESSSRSQPPVVRLELDHVTAVTRQSLVRFWTEAVRDLLDVRIDVRNSIMDFSAGGPLVLMEGHQDSDMLMQRLHWFGSRNVIVGDGEQGCVAHGLWPLSGDDWTYSLGQWQAQWQPDWEFATDTVTAEPVLTWEGGSETPLNRLQMSDLALRPMATADSANPASGTASDGTDRGIRPSLSSLPGTLPDPTADR
ncbi:MAG: serine/threonine protein kinase [Planctomycetaceae bacterium]